MTANVTVAFIDPRGMRHESVLLEDGDVLEVERLGIHIVKKPKDPLDQLEPGDIVRWWREGDPKSLSGLAIRRKNGPRGEVRWSITGMGGFKTTEEVRHYVGPRDQWEVLS